MSCKEGRAQHGKLWGKLLILLLSLLNGINALGSLKKEMPRISASSAYKLNSLFFSIDYLSQTNTLGVVNESVKQPNYSSSLLFYSAHNFDIGISAIITDNSDSTFTKASTEFDFMGGYTFSVSDDLVIYPSYTHFEYSKNSYSLQSIFSDIIQTDIYLDKKHYYGGITASYLFGRKNMFFASFQNAIGFEKTDFLFKNSYLSVQLEFDINFSDKNFYNEYIYNEWDTDEFLSWISEYYPKTYALLDNQIKENGLEPTKTRFFELLKEYEPENFNSSYAVTSVDFMLPIYYNVGSFMFNFTTYVVIPTFSSMFYEQNTMFIFNAGIAYILSF